MELKIASFEALSKDICQDSASIHGWLRGVDPKGHYERKFIVLVHRGNQNLMYLLIGPNFIDARDHPDFYMHKHLRQVALCVFDPKGGQYGVSGGGLLGFKYEKFYKVWGVDLGGASSDYGVWDYRLLEHRQTIAEWLSMNTYFSWRESVYPAQKRGA